jgi:hypothetical protein
MNLANILTLRVRHVCVYTIFLMFILCLSNFPVFPSSLPCDSCSAEPHFFYVIVLSNTAHAKNGDHDIYERVRLDPRVDIITPALVLTVGVQALHHPCVPSRAESS